jgi:tyrosyl-tRNA synthetase
VILIVGDWTAQIGDPSGQSITRPMLTHDEVVENAESYMRQFFRVVDRERTRAVWQSEWFGKFTLTDVIGLTSRFTVAQFLNREDFARRFQAQRPIAITELLYPLLQAYDSVAIEADVEFGGTDQRFNLLVGRELQEMRGQRPQQCFLMPILVGTDGVQKMSKSLDNYIGVEEPPNDMYGKLMSLPDQLIAPYLEYLTDTPDDELSMLSASLDSGAVNPMDVKKRLALDITSQFHSLSDGQRAQANFEQVVQRRDLPEDIPEFNLSPNPGPGRVMGATFASLSHLLAASGLASSNSEAKRLLNEGAIELIRKSGESQKISAGYVVENLQSGDVLKRGGRQFVRLVGE